MTQDPATCAMRGDPSPARGRREARAPKSSFWGAPVRWLCLGLSALLIAAFAGPVFAADGRARLALVIGNAKYKTLEPLSTTLNDAQDVDGALRKLGFEVTTVLDADAERMRAELDKFTKLLKTERYANALAVFYFAGHGLQRAGKNYILPVSFDKDRDRQKLDDNAIWVDTRIVSPMSEGRAAVGGRGPQNVVILDASRDDPFGEKDGLAQMELVPKGMLVAFSAKAGEKVSDDLNRRSPERNSIYTKQLLRELEQPNPATDLVTSFKTVRNKVVDGTNNKQDPYVTSDFNGIDVASIAPAGAPVLASADDTNMWNEVVESEDLCDFEAYRDRFPKGNFASAALVKIGEMKKAADAFEGLVVKPGEAAKLEWQDQQRRATERCAARWKRSVTAQAVPKARVQPGLMHAVYRPTTPAAVVRPVAFFSREGDDAERIFKATALNAKQGDVDAMYRLALMHETGYGPAARDQGKMLLWLRLASALGNGPASYKLYRHYAAQATGYARSVRFHRIAQDQSYYGPVGLSSRR